MKRGTILVGLVLALVACRESKLAPSSPPVTSASPAEVASASSGDAGDAGTSPSMGKRCGWIDNPTPGNWSLEDRDGTWEIGVQGGFQAEGDLPDFGKEWVMTNAGQHGYGCACLRVRVDRTSRRILVVKDPKVLPLRRCKEDKALRQRAPHDL